MKIPERVFLTGFMGSGKSARGKELARLLTYEFIDLDSFIEENEKRSVSDVFEKDGEHYFRELEIKWLGNVIRKNNSAVISLGGGTICNNNTIQLVKSSGVLIYLMANEGLLLQRLQAAKKTRPLIAHLEEPALKNFIHEKLQEREPFYNQAHIKVNTAGLKSIDLLKSIETFYAI